MSKTNCMYGLTKDLKMVKISLCKCIKCQERGMWECFLDYADGRYCDCVRLDRLNKDLIYASTSYDKALAMQKKLRKQKEKQPFIRICEDGIEIGPLPTYPLNPFEDERMYKNGFNDGYKKGFDDSRNKSQAEKRLYEKYLKAYKKVCKQLAEKTIAPKEYWEKWGLDE